jgi:hypothetical protein
MHVLHWQDAVDLIERRALGDVSLSGTEKDILLEFVAEVRKRGHVEAKLREEIWDLRSNVAQLRQKRRDVEASRNRALARLGVLQSELASLDAALHARGSDDAEVANRGVLGVEDWLKRRPRRAREEKKA